MRRMAFCRPPPADRGTWGCLGRAPGRWWLAAAVLAAATASAQSSSQPSVPTDAGLPTVEYRGTLALPDRAPTADGTEVGITGLSGITWLGADRYAAVMDNSDLLLRFRLALARDGTPVAVTDLAAVRLGERHDYEDLAPCPAPLARRIAAKRGCAADGILLLCEEDTPAIRAVAADGALLGVVPVPEILRGRRSNRGLEALAVDPDGHVAWTANEEALPGDGPAPTTEAGTVVRLVRIPLPADDGAAGSSAQFAYATDPPHPFARVFPGEPFAGVTALVALGAGRLLVLERSAGPGLPPFANRILLVDTAAATDVSAIDRDLASRADVVGKRPLWQESLGCNLEGLCLGPPLPAGGRALVAIADNGGIGTPNQLVGLVLRPPRAAIDAFTAGTIAVLVVLALIAARLTSP